MKRAAPKIVPKVDIAESYRQLQRLRKMVKQAEARVPLKIKPTSSPRSNSQRLIQLKIVPSMGVAPSVRALDQVGRRAVCCLHELVGH
jgi:hypothetical protein